MKPNLTDARSMTHLNEARLNKVLDGIESRLGNVDNRLGSIESDLKDVITLNERVNNHGETLRRFGKDIDTLRERQRSADITMAQHESIERLVKHIQTDIDSIKNDHSDDMRKIDRKIDKELEGIKEIIEELTKTGSVNKGKSEVSNSIFKWVSGVLAIIVAWLVTGK